jgi:hypothetical protein
MVARKIVGVSSGSVVPSLPICFRKMLAQISASVRLWRRHDLFRRACGHHLSAGIATLRSQIDNVVSSLNHVEVVFDDQERTSGFNQGAKRPQQFVDVVEMQAGSWLIENVERPGAGAFRELSCQLNPLRFATRKRSR